MDNETFEREMEEVLETLGVEPPEPESRGYSLFVGLQMELATLGQTVYWGTLDSVAPDRSMFQGKEEARNESLMAVAMTSLVWASQHREQTVLVIDAMPEDLRSQALAISETICSAVSQHDR